ncbi:PAS domain-containing protein [Roseomonas stagni]|uniref:histidine kinase n=1 Tax=Falsiroseomonas algicola TaxID=2716930 RepID=A0A6M1LQH5_9PROT|nr:HWE histidine kinase domain-containing protein [Falsiroseomonas algicola]NGM22363.1 PAS domain-containing protein [Falsiroseomonas algicola]
MDDAARGDAVAGNEAERVLRSARRDQGAARRVRAGFAILLAGVVAALLPLAAIGIYAAMEANRSHRVESEARLMDVARTVAATLDSELQLRLGIARLLASLAAFDDLADTPAEEMQHLFRRLQDSAAILGGATLNVWTGVAGPAETPVRIVSTLQPFAMMRAPVSTPAAEEVIRRAAQTRRPAVGRPFDSVATGNTGLLIAYPVLRNEAVVAVLTVSLRQADIQAVLRQQTLPNGTIAGVVHRDGQLLARVPEAHIGETARPAVMGAIGTATSGGFRGQSLDGQAVVGAFTALQLAPDYVIAVAAPEAVVEADWIRTRTLLLAGAAGAVAMTVLALLLSGGAWRSTRGLVQNQDAWLNIALDKTGLATWESDQATGRAVWSPRHFDLLGYPREPSGRVAAALWWEAVHPDDRAQVRQQWKASGDNPDGLVRLTYRIIRRDDGQVRWCESISRFVAPGRLAGVIMDVTDLRRQEEERLLLAREVDHRSKNLLAVVQAMVSMTRADSAEALRAALSQRVLSLAKTHTLLARNRWQGSTMREVAENELRANGEAIRLEGDAIALRPEAVQPLAMALHELATNAVKYGALSVAGGQVSLAWREAEGQLVLEWREASGPPVQAPASSGFGSRMIARVLAQLGGTIAFDWRAEGLHAVITMPMDRIIPGGSNPPSEAVALDGGAA